MFAKPSRRTAMKRSKAKQPDTADVARVGHDAEGEREEPAIANDGALIS